MTAALQAALYYNRLRRRPRPQAFAFADVPDATVNEGVTITIIDRNYRLALSDGAVWNWSGTAEAIS